MKIRISYLSMLLLCCCGQMSQTSSDKPDRSTAGSTPKGEQRRYIYGIDVETPDGVVSGQSVNGRVTECRNTLNGNVCFNKESSEGVMVTLPDGKSIYSLLTHNGEPEYVCCYHAGNLKPGFGPAYSEFKTDRLPDMVYFENENDPKSVKVLRTDKPLFGKYRIKRVYIQNTSLALTDVLSKRLKWLATLDGPLCLCRSGRNNGTDAQRFGRFSFMER